MDSCDQASGNVGGDTLEASSSDGITRAESGGSGLVSIPFTGQPGAEQFSFKVPNDKVALIIGKEGKTIENMQARSGARIEIIPSNLPPGDTSSERTVYIDGSEQQIEAAKQLVNEVISEAESGGSGLVSIPFTVQPGAEQFSMKVPNDKVGLIIGKGGKTIENMQARSGARIQIIPLNLSPGDTSSERTVYIDGSEQQIEAAKQLVNEVISEILIDAALPKHPKLEAEDLEEVICKLQEENNFLKLELQNCKRGADDFKSTAGLSSRAPSSSPWQTSSSRGNYEPGSEFASALRNYIDRTQYEDGITSLTKKIQEVRDLVTGEIQNLKELIPSSLPTEAAAGTNVAPSARASTVDDTIQAPHGNETSQAPHGTHGASPADDRAQRERVEEELIKLAKETVTEFRNEVLLVVGTFTVTTLSFMCRYWLLFYMLSLVPIFVLVCCGANAYVVTEQLFSKLKFQGRSQEVREKRKLVNLLRVKMMGFLLLGLLFLLCSGLFFCTQGSRPGGIFGTN